MVFERTNRLRRAPERYSISDLTSVTQLLLSDNQLSGLIPPEVASLLPTSSGRPLEKRGVATFYRDLGTVFFERQRPPTAVRTGLPEGPLAGTTT